MLHEKPVFLLISGSTDSYWSLILAQALESLGKLQVSAEIDAVMLLRNITYNLIIVDTSEIEHGPRLIEHIRAEQPDARVVIMTASPTWTRAREAFLAGAIDYARKSLDPDEIRSVIVSALNKPLSSH